MEALGVGWAKAPLGGGRPGSMAAEGPPPPMTLVPPTPHPLAPADAAGFGTPPPGPRKLLVLWLGLGKFEWRFDWELLPFEPFLEEMEGAWDGVGGGSPVLRPQTLRPSVSCALRRGGKEGRSWGPERTEGPPPGGRAGAALPPPLLNPSRPLPCPLPNILPTARRAGGAAGGGQQAAPAPAVPPGAAGARPAV
jgi:hypothetical protein